MSRALESSPAAGRGAHGPQHRLGKGLPRCRTSTPPTTSAQAGRIRVPHTHGAASIPRSSSARLDLEAAPAGVLGATARPPSMRRSSRRCRRHARPYADAAADPAGDPQAVGLLREHGMHLGWFGGGAARTGWRRRCAGRAPSGSWPCPPRRQPGRAQPAAALAPAAPDRESTDTITYLGEYTRSRIAGVLTPKAAVDRATAARGRREDLPSGLGGATRSGAPAYGPSGGRLRLPAGAAQGPGHADPA
ncbi:hypothetical protein SHIRM173S_13216 [Streptomyces hirsutus]